MGAECLSKELRGGGRCEGRREREGSVKRGKRPEGQAGPDVTGLASILGFEPSLSESCGSQ